MAKKMTEQELKELANERFMKFKEESLKAGIPAFSMSDNNKLKSAFMKNLSAEYGEKIKSATFKELAADLYGYGISSIEDFLTKQDEESFENSVFGDGGQDGEDKAESGEPEKESAGRAKTGRGRKKEDEEKPGRGQNEEGEEKAGRGRKKEDEEKPSIGQNEEGEEKAGRGRKKESEEGKGGEGNSLTKESKNQEDGKERDGKDRDSGEGDSRERDSRERDGRERDSRERDGREKIADRDEIEASTASDGEEGDSEAKEARRPGRKKKTEAEQLPTKRSSNLDILLTPRKTNSANREELARLKQRLRQLEYEREVDHRQLALYRRDLNILDAISEYGKKRNIDLVVDGTSLDGRINVLHAAISLLVKELDAMGADDCFDYIKRSLSMRTDEDEYREKKIAELKEKIREYEG